MAKVLLAEDDEFSRDMLARRLERNGYEMLAAADGREALRSARLHRPDLILMDLDMPVMDGRTAIRVLKRDPQTREIPIIVLSAFTSVQDVADAVRAGCQGYEAKPVVLRRLIEKIRELLEMKKKS